MIDLEILDGRVDYYPANGDLKDERCHNLGLYFDAQ